MLFTMKLLDPENPHYLYDLLGLLKGELVPRFYIDAGDECPDVREALRLSEELGAISAYAYLGDVTDSVTGDKRAQRFEDAYLDELFEVISSLGFRAVTYMPSRNTPEQLLAVRKKCAEYGLLEISGEDINSPRQAFVCRAQQSGEFAHLADAAWALIAHERAPEGMGLFSDCQIAAYPQLAERVKYFAEIGHSMSF